MELKTTGEGAGIVAREIALDVADACYRPNLAKHLAGITNKAADALSRFYTAEVNQVIPDFLANIPRKRLVDRDHKLFRTI